MSSFDYIRLIRQFTRLFFTCFRVDEGGLEMEIMQNRKEEKRREISAFDCPLDSVLKFKRYSLSRFFRGDLRPIIIGM